MALGNPISLTDNVASRLVSATATAGQTSFTVSGGYRINAISVYRNGVKLSDNEDFTAADGSTVVLTNAANVGDTLAFEIFDDFRVADAIVSAASSQTIGGDLVVTGRVYGATVGVQSGGVNIGTAKTLNFSNAADLNLIKTKVTGKTANLAGIDADAVIALIDDTATSIKNVNDEIAKVTDLTSDATKAAFSTMQALIEEVKEAVKAEVNLAGSGDITYTDTSVVEAAAKNKAPSDIALSATSISEGASSLIIGTVSTTDSDQTGGVAFKYSIVAADGTDHAAFTINAETGELSLNAQPDYETKSSYKVIIKSTDEGRKSYQEEFEITVNNVLESYSEAPIKVYINQYNRALISEYEKSVADYNAQVEDFIEIVDKNINNFGFEISSFELTSTGFSIAQGNSDEFVTEVTFANFNPGSLKDLNDLKNIDSENPDTWIIQGGLSEILYKENGLEILTLALDEDSLTLKSPLVSDNSVNSIKFLGTFSNQFPDLMNLTGIIAEASLPAQGNWVNVTNPFEIKFEDTITDQESVTLEKYSISGLSINKNDNTEVASYKLTDSDTIVISVDKFKLEVETGITSNNVNLSTFNDGLADLDGKNTEASIKFSHSDLGTLIEVKSDLTDTTMFPYGLERANSPSVTYASSGSQNIASEDFVVTTYFTFEDGLMSDADFETYYSELNDDVEKIFSEIV